MKIRLKNLKRCMSCMEDDRNGNNSSWWKKVKMKSLLEFKMRYCSHLYLQRGWVKPSFLLPAVCRVTSFPQIKMCDMQFFLFELWIATVPGEIRTSFLIFFLNLNNNRNDVALAILQHGKYYNRQSYPLFWTDEFFFSFFLLRRSFRF